MGKHLTFSRIIKKYKGDGSMYSGLERMLTVKMGLVLVVVAIGMDLITAFDMDRAGIARRIASVFASTGFFIFTFRIASKYAHRGGWKEGYEVGYQDARLKRKCLKLYKDDEFVLPDSYRLSTGHFPSGYAHYPKTRARVRKDILKWLDEPLDDWLTREYEDRETRARVRRAILSIQRQEEEFKEQCSDIEF